MFRARRRRNETKNGRKARRCIPFLLEVLEPRRLLATYPVTNTADTGAGSLRAAIVAADNDTGNHGTDQIVFDIPAGEPGDLTVPVPGFDPGTQDWTITLDSPLPAITRPVSIDGYTEGSGEGEPFLYPTSISSAVQTLSILGSPTGGSFTLTSSSPLSPGGTTAAIPFTADAGTVQGALAAIIGDGNVSVTGGPLPNNSLNITFQGAYAQEPIPDLIATGSLTGGNSPSVAVATSTIGGVAGSPTLITSVPNSTSALNGNNAHVRVIIDGTNLPSNSADIGFVIDASNSILRGMAIEGFDVGVSIPPPPLGVSYAGDLIQGNFIGRYVTYPVDPQTGAPVSTFPVVISGSGNLDQGVILGSANATLGGTDAQDDNVIGGNGQQGILIEPGATGNQVLGNQIGVIGPTEGFFFPVANGGDGVSIESTGTASNPASIVYASSNVIGGAVGGAGNVISFNGGAGVHIAGVGATRNLIEANYIGAAPGGGFIFGSGDPGNDADGVWIDDAPDNQVGGGVASDGNVISSNAANGVDITGPDAFGNTVLNNIIGLISAGNAVLGNAEAGINDTAPGTVIGPGNVISANRIGVLISGATATNVTVTGNLIGTDSTGEADLGNAEAGVDIESATGVVVKGNGQGSQVISGNQIGVEINGATSTQNLVEGNFIGIDEAGSADRGNSDEGVLIEGAFENTLGGTTAAARNVISANLWGIDLNGSTATGNTVLGNYVGTDATGTLPLGNEIDGIIIEGAPGNTVGGTTAAASNLISANSSGIQLDGPAATDNLVAGNLIGTDVTGTLPLGNEVNGVIFTDNASNNTVGGTADGQGNTIAFNVAAGVIVESGIGDSILSNSIYSNGQQGIDLSGPGNDGQSAPVVSAVSGGGSVSNIQGSLSSVANTVFLIQFFSSPVPDPSGFGQGQTFVGSITITTDASGNANINFNLPGGLTAGEWLTATATKVTNQNDGDTSAFSNAFSAQPVSLSFATASYTVNSTDGSATIDVQRSGNLGVTISVNYATSNGTAISGQDFTAVAGTLVMFPSTATVESFTVPILNNTQPTISPSSVSLILSQPAGGASLGSISAATVTIANQSNQTQRHTLW